MRTAITRFFILLSGVAALLTGRLIAQISLGPQTFLTSEQLTASAGSESVAAEIVTSVFANRLSLIGGFEWACDYLEPTNTGELVAEDIRSAIRPSR
jgi:hypothetical protein